MNVYTVLCLYLERGILTLSKKRIISFSTIKNRLLTFLLLNRKVCFVQLERRVTFSIINTRKIVFDLVGGG